MARQRGGAVVERTKFEFLKFLGTGKRRIQRADSCDKREGKKWLGGKNERHNAGNCQSKNEGLWGCDHGKNAEEKYMTRGGGFPGKVVCRVEDSEYKLNAMAETPEKKGQEIIGIEETTSVEKEQLGRDRSDS